MAQICSCNPNISNTGRPNCIPLMSVPKRLIFVSMAQADGTLNRIDITATLNQAFLDALTNNADDLQKWFPLGNFVNVETAREDSVKEEFSDGSSVKIESGTSAFSGQLVKGNVDLLRKIEEWGCTEFGVYIVDKAGNLIGDKSVAGYLAPIPVNANSFDPLYIWGTDSTVEKVTVKFELDKIFEDSYLGMILKGDFDAAVNLFNEDGLVDLFGAIEASAPAPTATSLTIVISTDYGSVVNPKVVTGLDLVTDFEIVGSTSGATPIATSVETSGSYAITFTSLTGETVYLQKKTATLGYGDLGLIAETVTV